MAEIYSRIQQKHDIEENWIKLIDFVPLDGELIIYDIDKYYKYKRFKVGDGITKLSDLPFHNTQVQIIIWEEND